LSQPVVSIGNLRAGGSGKTPLVETIARLLESRGERPVVLTRGYARRVTSDGVTVVSDRSGILQDARRAGDEPLMLARHLPGVPVLVTSDRYLAGRLAERHFDATVHVLDDGFQSVSLARDVNLLVVGEEDLDEPVIPAGCLREPIEAASNADALLVHGSEAAAVRLGRKLRVAPVFQVRRALGPASPIATNDRIPASTREPIVAVAAIARPQRFFDDLAAAGWQVAAAIAFRDHHWFTAADVDLVSRRSRDVGARWVLTTEKDAVRFEVCDLGSLRLAAVPLTSTIEPAGVFGDYLWRRIRAAHRAVGPFHLGGDAAGHR
jgi:tetraacyldisaccharide 4'-kinase